MATILRHAPSFLLVRRSFIYSKNFVPKRFLSDTSREKLWNAVEECKKLQFTAQRVSVVLGHNFSSSHSHDIVEFCCDKKGNFHDIRGTVDKNVGKLYAYDVSFNNLFKKGFGTVEYLLQQESNLNHNSSTHLTLGALLKYMEDIDFHQECMDMPVFRSELDVATVLAVHLFSQLAVDQSTPSYMITNDFNFKHVFCPCDHQKCKQELMYGNTGFGSEYLFYGYPDIILFPQGVGSSSVVVPRNKKKKEYKELLFNNEDDDHMQMVEVKSNEEILRSRESENQFSSVAITFSYYQRLKQYRKKIENKNDQIVSIIPTIAICQDCFDIYMYDTEHDIFLRNVGDPIPLWEDEDNLSLSSVLILWMVLNHLQFKPKIPKFMEEIIGSSGVGQKLDTEKLELIIKTLRKTRSKLRRLKVNEINKRNVERITEE